MSSKQIPNDGYSGYGNITNAVQRMEIKAKYQENNHKHIVSISAPKFIQKKEQTQFKVMN